MLPTRGAVSYAAAPAVAGGRLRAPRFWTTFARLAPLRLAGVRIASLYGAFESELLQFTVYGNWVQSRESPKPRRSKNLHVFCENFARVLRLLPKFSCSRPVPRALALIGFAPKAPRVLLGDMADIFCCACRPLGWPFVSMLQSSLCASRSLGSARCQLFSILSSVHPAYGLLRFRFCLNDQVLLVLLVEFPENVHRNRMRPPIPSRGRGAKHFGKARFPSSGVCNRFAPSNKGTVFRAALAIQPAPVARSEPSYDGWPNRHQGYPRGSL